MNQDNPNEWKVGDALFCISGIGRTSITKYEIVRETPTTFVLNNGEKIRKGKNRIIGGDSFYGGSYYSEKCDYGAALKRKYERLALEKKIRGLPLETFHIDKLKRIIEIAEAK